MFLKKGNIDTITVEGVRSKYQRFFATQTIGAIFTPININDLGQPGHGQFLSASGTVPLIEVEKSQ
ncbi:MAG: hypothetical protein M3Q07_23850 [Pseudobdellovibrionaceae bacterium]|nr:hypothetical protein [Pseudobdellovibrionaceae bacterium]